MIDKLSPGGRRVLALLLLLVPVTVIAALVAVPAQLGRQHEADLEALQAEVAELEEGLVVREQVLAELRRLERATEGDPRLLQAETPALAGAVLAGELSDKLEKVGGFVDSSQVLEPVVEGPVTRIGVRLRGHVDVGGLRAFLHSIESREQLLTVERLSIAGVGFDGNFAMIQTDITVVGYARNGLATDTDEDQTAAAADAG